MASSSGSLLCLVCAVTCIAVPGAAIALESEAVSKRSFQETQTDPEAVLLRFDVQPNGTAVARVQYRYRLGSANETAGFERLQRDIQNNSTAFTSRFERRMRSMEWTAENATGRQMTIENVSIRTDVRQLPQEYGLVTYSFVWREFAATDGDQLVIGSALNGLFLDEESRLVIEWPPEFEPLEVHESVDEQDGNTAIWVGPTDFDQQGPRILVAPSATGGGVPTPFLAVAAVLIVVVGGGLLGYRRLQSRQSESGDPASTRQIDAQNGSTSAAVSGDGTDDLLSDEERVLQLLGEQGGRMKQQEVIETLGWSDAKGSRVVTRLREDGQIESFRLGNENVLRMRTDTEGREP